MKQIEFNKLLLKIPVLENGNFRLLKEKVEKRVKSKKVSNILETPINEVECPYCNSREFLRWGFRNDLQRYKCKSCNKTYNSLTNTPLARLRRKGHWLDYANCLKEGLTVRSAAEQCGIHRNTSFRWRHRFINNGKKIKTKYLAGIIEIDKSTFKESFKGCKDPKKIPKRKRKPIFVIFNIDRNNNIFDITNKGFNKKIIDIKLNPIINESSLILFKENILFKQYFDTKKIDFKEIQENSKELNQIKYLTEYKDNFKDWIYNTFKGVATKYLENYVSWYRYLKEFKSGILRLTILYRAKSVEKYRHQPLKMTSVVL